MCSRSKISHGVVALSSGCLTFCNHMSCRFSSLALSSDCAKAPHSSQKKKKKKKNEKKNELFLYVLQVFRPLMEPLLCPATVPKHPIRHLHERAQQDGKLLRFVCSVSNPRAEGMSPMEEAEEKKRRGEVPEGLTVEQAAADAQQVNQTLSQLITLSGIGTQQKVMQTMSK